jgi:hypothetical protein
VEFFSALTFVFAVPFVAEVVYHSGAHLRSDLCVCRFI